MSLAGGREQTEEERFEEERGSERKSMQACGYARLRMQDKARLMVGLKSGSGSGPKGCVSRERRAKGARKAPHALAPNSPAHVEPLAVRLELPLHLG
eukprot:642837-Pleurochrysis_carterae.AAC.1